MHEPGLLASKLLEEAAELTRAQSKDEITAEAADVIFFTLVAMARSGVALSDVEAELDKRALRVSRRPGNAKPEAKAPPPKKPAKKKKKKGVRDQ